MVCWEEKPVPLANCYEVNECRAGENIQIPLLNTGEKDTNQWNVTGMNKVCIMHLDQNIGIASTYSAIIYAVCLESSAVRQTLKRKWTIFQVLL